MRNKLVNSSRLFIALGLSASLIAWQPVLADDHQAKSNKVSKVDTGALVTSDMYPKPKQQPNYGPRYGSIEFTDTDPGEGIAGVLTMGRAVDENGNRISEVEHGITTYMVHWGLQVGEPGTQDDKGAGDHGGDCRGFRDTGHVVMKSADELDNSDTISWEIPEGTEVPDGAVYFVGHTLYGQIHNLGKCTQTEIVNR